MWMGFLQLRTVPGGGGGARRVGQLRGGSEAGGLPHPLAARVPSAPPPSRLSSPLEPRVRAHIRQTGMSVAQARQ